MTKKGYQRYQNKRLKKTLDAYKKTLEGLALLLFDLEKRKVLLENVSLKDVVKNKKVYYEDEYYDYNEAAKIAIDDYFRGVFYDGVRSKIDTPLEKRVNNLWVFYTEILINRLEDVKFDKVVILVEQMRKGTYKPSKVKPKLHRVKTDDIRVLAYWYVKFNISNAKELIYHIRKIYADDTEKKGLFLQIIAKKKRALQLRISSEMLCKRDKACWFKPFFNVSEVEGLEDFAQYAKTSPYFKRYNRLKSKIETQLKKANKKKTKGLLNKYYYHLAVYIMGVNIFSGKKKDFSAADKAFRNGLRDKRKDEFYSNIHSSNTFNQYIRYLTRSYDLLERFFFTELMTYNSLPLPPRIIVKSNRIKPSKTPLGRRPRTRAYKKRIKRTDFNPYYFVQKYKKGMRYFHIGTISDVDYDRYVHSYIYRYVSEDKEEIIYHGYFKTVSATKKGLKEQMEEMKILDYFVTSKFDVSGDELGLFLNEKKEKKNTRLKRKSRVTAKKAAPVMKKNNVKKYRNPDLMIEFSLWLMIVSERDRVGMSQNWEAILVKKYFKGAKLKTLLNIVNNYERELDEEVGTLVDERRSKKGVFLGGKTPDISDFESDSFLLDAIKLLALESAEYEARTGKLLMDTDEYSEFIIEELELGNFHISVLRGNIDLIDNLKMDLLYRYELKSLLGLKSSYIEIPKSLKNTGISDLKPSIKRKKITRSTTKRATPSKKSVATKKRTTVSTKALSWSEFTRGKMGKYMKSEGDHSGAMKRLSKEWKIYKGGKFSSTRKGTVKKSVKTQTKRATPPKKRVATVKKSVTTKNKKTMAKKKLPVILKKINVRASEIQKAGGRKADKKVKGSFVIPRTVATSRAAKEIKRKEGVIRKRKRANTKKAANKPKSRTNSRRVTRKRR